MTPQRAFFCDITAVYVEICMLVSDPDCTQYFWAHIALFIAIGHTVAALFLLLYPFYRCIEKLHFCNCNVLLMTILRITFE